MRKLIAQTILAAVVTTLLLGVGNSSAEAFWGRRWVAAYPVAVGYAPVTVGYAPAPVVVARPVVTAGYAPVTVGYAPATTAFYAPAPVTTFYAPAPVTTYYSPTPVNMVVPRSVVHRPVILWP